MNKYFKVRKDSEVGERFSELIERWSIVKNRISDFLLTIGADSYYTSSLCCIGAISDIVFKEEPNMKIWKKSKTAQNTYTPRLSSKEGKKMEQRIKACGEIRNIELNLCIGYNESWECIGFSGKTTCEYYSFNCKCELSAEVLAQCVEITAMEHEEL